MAETRKFGRYVVRETIGRGAMGVVYLAEDPLIGRKVAIKVIEAHEGLEEDELVQLQARFEREFQSAGQLSHPNIVSVHDVGQEGADSFIAMEFVHGESLHSVLADNRIFSFKEVADIAAQLGSALDFAHERGIVHRDIKPANILITREGRPKITDFGVAKVATTTLTRTGTVVGTPAYMSPEQVTGHPVTGAADQFSLAVMLYQLVTGERPFTAESPTTIMYKIVHEEPIRPSALNVAIPAPVDAALLRALSKNPGARYPTCTELAEALRAALGAAPGDATVVMSTRPAEATMVDASLSPIGPAPSRATGSGLPIGTLAAVGGVVLAVVLAAGAWRAGVFGAGPAGEAEPGTTAPPVVTHTLTVDASPGWEIWVDGVASGVSTPGAVELSGAAGDEKKLELRFEGRLLAAGTITLDGAAPDVWAPEGSGGLAATDPSGADGQGTEGGDAGDAGDAAGGGDAAAANRDLAVFRIASTPAGARVTFDGEVLAQPTPVEVEVDLSQRHSVKIEADGYDPAGWEFGREDLSGEQIASRRLDFPLTSSVPPGFLVIDNPAYPVAVTVTPQGGGSSVSAPASSSHNIRLLPGTYDVELSAPSVLWSGRRSVTIESETSRDQPLPDVVAVRINASPGNCTISINGREMGAPPFTQSLVVGEEYTFVFDWSALDMGTKTITQRINRTTDRIVGEAGDRW
jgi:serine/threonine-protein kinase